MATKKLNLTRQQLASFLKDHEQIRQFEALFKLADEVSPATDTEGISIQAGNADANATEALASLRRLARAVEILSGAPSNRDDNSIAADYVDLCAAPHVNKIRRLAWNATDEAPEIGMDYEVVQQIGLEWYARVGNTTGSTIPNGTVVGFAGATTNALLVEPYLADCTCDTLYILGVMTHDLPDSGEMGYATAWGFVRDMDTSAFSVGDVLYASPTVAGGLTNVKPTAPNGVIPLAACVVSDATEGVIFVRPTIEQQKYYGIFEKTTDQTPAVINTEYLLTFDNAQISNGVEIGMPTSRIVVPESGLYQFDATLQFSSSSSSSKNVWVWWKHNGVAVSNSARIMTSDINNGYRPVAFGKFFSLAANDYIELAFAASSTAITAKNVAATAFAPAAPAVILNVTQVQQ